MKRLFTIIFLAALALPVRAQIVITAADYLAIASQMNSATTYATTDMTGFANILAVNGTGKTWDFTGRTWTISPQTVTASIVTYPGGAPMANDPDFATATHVIISTPTDQTKATYYQFVKITSDGVWILGMSEDSLGVKAKVLGYSPGEQQLAFPLQYQSTWQSTSAVSSPQLPPGGSITYHRQSVVDSWGTLITPPASSSQSLRIRTEADQTISFGPVNMTSRNYSFEWVTKSGYGAGVGADSNQKPLTATYSEAAGASNSVAQSAMDALSSDPLTIRLSANPVSNSETELSYTLKSEGPARVSMMDLLGRNVRMLQDGYARAGENVIPIDPKAVPAGTYLLHVEADGTSATRKLIITR